MANPVPYSPDLESTSEDEAQILAEMIATFRKIQETTAKDYGRAVRGVHAKSHGLLKGSLTVAAGLPPALAQGFCAREGRYEAVVRLSTNPGDVLDDSVSTPRGLALKILGVQGERLPDSEGTTQDFVMADAPAFVAPDAAAFLKSLKLLAATTDTPQILKKGLSALMRGVESTLEAFGTKSARIVSLGGHPQTHILGATFYSQVPVRWGDNVAKISLAPVSPALRALSDAKMPASGHANALRDAVVAFFAEQDATWELRVQLLTNRETMPIEDASVVWPETESPYVTVARLDVPRQDAWSDGKVREIDEGLAFSPWHGLIAHQPLGSIMRARRAAYPRSAGFRAHYNHCPIHEPGARR